MISRLYEYVDSLYHGPQCTQGNTIIASWERSGADPNCNATLTMQHAALPVATEIVTTLVVNRMRLELGW
jgi:hypothetical protein